MESWSNIEIAPDDPEILKIDKFEKLLGDIPPHVVKIRELITGFEVCHFKYQQHIKYILTSITSLKPNIELQRIGAHHIRQAEVEWRKDRTGRSQTGQQYLKAIEAWIEKNPEAERPDSTNDQFENKIWEWLGEKDPEKERLARLLVARLKWDWESYEKLLNGDDQDELEFQVCRMDICHYAFPENMDRIIQAIGKGQPVKDFEGCGSYNNEIKGHIKKEIKSLNDQIKSFDVEKELEKEQIARIWLLSCLVKTIKEQAGLKEPIYFFDFN